MLILISHKPLYRRFRHELQHGFTLIEMLIVLTIMGVVAGMATASARPDASATLRVESQRLAELLDQAATKARLGGRSIAWTAQENHYDFWVLSRDDGWTRIVDDSLLRERTLPTGMSISQLTIENVPSTEAMRVEFTAHGSSLAFKVDLSLGPAHVSVVSSPIGEVRLSAPGDDSAFRS